MANEWVIEERKKEKRKSLFMKIGMFILAVLIFIVYGFYGKFIFGKPSQLFESNLNKVGSTEEFEFSIRGGWHYIGIAINENRWLLLDGNYTVEYHKEGKFLRKETINKNTIFKHYKEGLYGGGSKHWVQMPFGKLKEDGKYKVKITVHSIEKPLLNYKEKVYFFVDRPKKSFRIEDNYTPEEAEARREKYDFIHLLSKNIMDVNETNQALIPLRKALDENSYEKVKSIIKTDNNITVDTDMIMKRRVLHYATFYNNVKLAKYLIDKGADIHYKDKVKKNALAYAIENNSTTTAKLLIDSGADVNEVIFVQNFLRRRLDIEWDGAYLKYDRRRVVISPLQYTAGNVLLKMTELLLENNIIDNDSGEIIEKGGDHIYHAIYYSRNSMTEEERNRVLEIFKKYNFIVKKPKPIRLK